MAANGTQQQQRKHSGTIIRPPKRQATGAEDGVEATRRRDPGRGGAGSRKQRRLGGMLLPALSERRRRELAGDAAGEASKPPELARARTAPRAPPPDSPHHPAGAAYKRFESCHRSCRQGLLGIIKAGREPRSSRPALWGLCFSPRRPAARVIARCRGSAGSWPRW
jgi:hypothetical protein